MSVVHSNVSAAYFDGSENWDLGDLAGSYAWSDALPVEEFNDRPFGGGGGCGGYSLFWSSSCGAASAADRADDERHFDPSIKRLRRRIAQLEPPPAIDLRLLWDMNLCKPPAVSDAPVPLSEREELRLENCEAVSPELASRAFEEARQARWKADVRAAIASGDL
jgi:hypothetical protein